MMKLKNSVPAATDKLSSVISHDSRVPNMVSAVLFNPKIKDRAVAIRWNLWHFLPQTERDQIIGYSLPVSEKVGGYWQHLTDQHIETLLKASITDEVLNLLVKP